MNIGSDSLMQDLLDEKLTGYKVCRPKNSCSFKPATSLALQRVTYRLDQETRQERGEFGPLAIFDTLENAEAFVADSDVVIFLVEYEPSDEDELWKKNPPHFFRQHGRMSMESQGTTEKSLANCPAGTIFAKSVFLLERVK